VKVERTGVEPVNKDTIFDQIEEYDEKISELYEGQPLIHFMSKYFVRQFKKAKRAANYYVIEDASQINGSVDFTDHVIVGLPSMSGTKDLFTTFKSNLLHISKRPWDSAKFDLQKADRVIKLLCDWWEAVGLGCNSLVWATKETVEPYSETSGSGS